LFKPINLERHLGYYVIVTLTPSVGMDGHLPAYILSTSISLVTGLASISDRLTAAASEWYMQCIFIETSLVD